MDVIGFQIVCICNVKDLILRVIISIALVLFDVSNKTNS